MMGNAPEFADPKNEVREFWDAAACGERLYLSEDDYADQARRRYELEPYIAAFAGFDSAQGKRVLEIGVGLGADHERFARASARLTGIDLTGRAIEHTRRRFQAAGLKSDLSVGDAEGLRFPDNTFDIVYSWGVIHHTPNVQLAIGEILRVLKPGGEARIMIYHKYSLVGFMLWVRYSLMKLRWHSLDYIYSNFLESPGTKAYSTSDAEKLFASFGAFRSETVLTHGDLLASGAGQRHGGLVLSIARTIWPRALLRKFCRGFGLFMLIRASK